MFFLLDFLNNFNFRNLFLRKLYVNLGELFLDLGLLLLHESRSHSRKLDPYSFSFLLYFLLRLLNRNFEFPSLVDFFFLLFFSLLLLFIILFGSNVTVLHEDLLRFLKIDVGFGFQDCKLFVHEVFINVDSFLFINHIEIDSNFDIGLLAKLKVLCTHVAQEGTKLKLKLLIEDLLLFVSVEEMHLELVAELAWLFGFKNLKIELWVQSVVKSVI